MCKDCRVATHSKTMKTENPGLLNKSELASKTCSGQGLPTFQEQDEAWVPPHLLAGRRNAKDLTSLHILFSNACVQQHFVYNCAQCAIALYLHSALAVVPVWVAVKAILRQTKHNYLCREIAHSLKDCHAAKLLFSTRFCQMYTQTRTSS